MSVCGIQGQLLEVTVVGCKKLKDTEWISRQDPYVCLEYSSTKYRTRTHKDGGKNPTFQEKFVFTLIEGLREFNVVVWNSNKLTYDDLIGSGKIQLQKVLSQGYDDSPWPLQDKKGRHAGEVRLILHYANANASLRQLHRIQVQLHRKFLSTPQRHHSLLATPQLHRWLLVTPQLHHLLLITPQHHHSPLIILLQQAMLLHHHLLILHVLLTQQDTLHNCIITINQSLILLLIHHHHHHILPSTHRHPKTNNIILLDHILHIHILRHHTKPSFVEVEKHQSFSAS